MSITTGPRAYTVPWNFLLDIPQYFRPSFLQIVAKPYDGIAN